MSDSFRNRRSRWVVLAASLLLGCAHAVEYEGPTPSQGGGGGAGSAGGFAGAGRTAGTSGTAGELGGSATGAAAGSSGSAGGGGTGLVSDVFGKGGLGGTAGALATCDYPDPPDCDFARVDGCCKPLACERANGSDVFDTYPVESCRALVECVQANSGCSSAADPLCFQDENPSAPCLMQGYQASHTDLDGPFVWTRELVKCVCGYPR